MAGYRNLFIVNLQRGKPLEAQKVLDRAAKTAGTTVEFDLELAELYANLERQAPSLKAAMNPNALAVVNHAARLNPTNPNLRLKLADDFNVLGDPTNAARVYLQILDQFTGAGPLRDEVRVKLADI